MANYYRVSPKFWVRARERGWTDAQTNLALYLLTGEHRKLEGLYRLPRPYIASDLGWPARKVDEALAVVCASGFSAYDDEAAVVFIPKALKHQAPSTPNHIKGAIAQLERLPRTCHWHAFVMACALHCQRLADAIAIRWPSDADGISRAHASAPGVALSSNSLSNSNPPQPPADAGGAEVPDEQASPEKANPRALGTNPRAVGRRLALAQAAERSSLAVAGLSAPTDRDQAEWERLRTALHGAAKDGASENRVDSLVVAGVESSTLVLDGPEDAWSWATYRFAWPLAAWSENLGIPARLASADEHEGFADLGGVA